MKIKPRIAITHGDPAGIGPELIAKLLAMPELTDLADVVLVGDRHVFELGQRQAEVDWPMRAIDMEHPEGWWTGAPYAWFPMETIPPEEVEVSVVSAAAGQSSLRTLERAIDFTRAGLVDAILFGPFNKTSLHLAGMAAEDEHRHIAGYLGFTGHHSEVNMLDELITTRVTSHIALNRHFPANLQIHGNRIYIAPPRELHSLRSPPMTRLWRADHVRKAIWQRFPPSRHTSPVFSTLPSISSAYAGTGLRRRSSIKAKIFWNKIFDTATSASWNVT